MTVLASVLSQHTDMIDALRSNKNKTRFMIEVGFSEFSELCELTKTFDEKVADAFIKQTYCVYNTVTTPAS